MNTNFRASQLEVIAIACGFNLEGGTRNINL